MSADLPFVPHKGNDQIIAMRNRIAAIERIKFLTNVDLRDKSDEYKQLIDIELYVKFYKDEPSGTLIDETFCQRVADVVRELEKTNKEVLDNTLEAVPERVEQLYREDKNRIPVPTELKIHKKKSFIVNFFKRFISKKV